MTGGHALHLDNLFQFIVPLTFLAIWALTSLFNREAQPLPPRGGAAEPPRTGRDRNGGSRGDAPVRALNRDPSLRWSPPAGGPIKGGPRRPAAPTMRS